MFFHFCFICLFHTHDLRSAPIGQAKTKIAGKTSGHAAEDLGDQEKSGVKTAVETGAAEDPGDQQEARAKTAVEIGVAVDPGDQQEPRAKTAVEIGVAVDPGDQQEARAKTAVEIGVAVDPGDQQEARAKTAVEIGVAVDPGDQQEARAKTAVEIGVAVDPGDQQEARAKTAVEIGVAVDPGDQEKTGVKTVVKTGAAEDPEDQQETRVKTAVETGGAEDAGEVSGRVIAFRMGAAEGRNHRRAHRLKIFLLLFMSAAAAVVICLAFHNFLQAHAEELMIPASASEFSESGPSRGELSALLLIVPFVLMSLFHICFQWTVEVFTIDWRSSTLSLGSSTPQKRNAQQQRILLIQRVVLLSCLTFLISPYLYGFARVQFHEYLYVEPRLQKPSEIKIPPPLPDPKTNGCMFLQYASTPNRQYIGHAGILAEEVLAATYAEWRSYNATPTNSTAHVGALSAADKFSTDAIATTAGSNSVPAAAASDALSDLQHGLTAVGEL